MFFVHTVVAKIIAMSGYMASMYVGKESSDTGSIPGITVNLPGYLIN